MEVIATELLSVKRMKTGVSFYILLFLHATMILIIYVYIKGKKAKILDLYNQVCFWRIMLLLKNVIISSKLAQDETLWR